ncbi:MULTISPECIES: hypothetical protein [unclassified Streptomyces]|uniref:hypothetical protein n=1 Tax=unclassified Streptomyces TaxID=2593676 RepID=UPI002E287D1E|nr:hypothetical protein [Streptomyces sp. NBC_01429]
MPDDDAPEYKVGKKVSLNALQQGDDNDPQLQKYKESLDIGEGTAGTVTLRTLTLEVEDRPSTTWRLDDAQELADLKAKPFVLAEGGPYRLAVAFTVDDGIASGVKYLSVVYRKGIRVAKDNQMLGSFGKQDKEHTVRFPRHGWQEAPSGILSRGSYTAKASFVNDDEKEVAQFEYAFDIKTNWS